MSRRSRSWQLTYVPWYAVAGWGLLNAAADLAGGSVLWAVADGLLGAGVLAVTARAHVRAAATGEGRLRGELAQLVRERAGQRAWLNRDGHLLFRPKQRKLAWLSIQELLVLDENQVRDISDLRLAGGGKLAATFTSYTVIGLFSRVARMTDGMLLTVTADDVEHAPDPDSTAAPWYRRYPDTLRILRSGQAFADAAELAEVTARFREAEPVGPDEEEGEQA